jgi:peptidoglycan/xylan/chitin deacetylase (PgdA/CDA1 family)
MPHIPILTYHQVADNGVQPPDSIFARDYTYRSDFVAQMQYLAASGFTAVTHEDVYHWLMRQQPLPDRPIMITFDDGRLNVLENAFPVLASLGWKASVYVITALASGQPARGHALDVPSMTWDHLKVLRNAGWTIGSHTRNHLYLKGPQWSQGHDEQLLDELEGSRYDIEMNLGITPICFAYPGGKWDRHSERLVTRVYRSARLWAWCGQYAYCTYQTHPYRLPSMNISFHLPFEDFQRLVQRSHPSYWYQKDLDWDGQPRRRLIQRAFLRLVRITRRVISLSMR